MRVKVKLQFSHLYKFDLELDAMIKELKLR